MARGLDLPGVSPANEGHPVWPLVSRLKEHKILCGDKKQETCMTLIFIDRHGSLFTEMSEGSGRKYGKI